MRARNVKPGIFTNPDLARLGDSVFRLFIGLWCLADRKGRLKDEPDKIEAQIFPFRFQESNTPAYLDLLAAGDDPFIIRYEVHGQKYIQIKNFLKHQRPHHQESESIIPPCKKNFAPRCEDLRTNNVPNPPDSLIPDSLIPDTCIAPAGAKPYQLPDPKTEPRQCLVLSYKSRKGVAYDNREWDKSNFARCMVAAGTLLALCRDLGSAETCLNDMAAEYESKSLSWTLETIARNAPDWLRKNGRSDANASRAGLRLAIAQRKSEASDPKGMVRIAERATPAPLRDRPDSEDRDHANGEGGAEGFDESDMD